MQSYEVWTTRMSKQRLREHVAWLRRGRKGAGRLEVRDANLRNAELVAEASFARFEQCDLSRCKFHLNDLQGVELVECVGTEPSFLASRLDGATISRCAFEAANFGGAFLTSAHISASRFAALRAERMTLSQASITNCDLRGALFEDFVAEHAKFIECDLRNAVLRRHDRVLDLARLYDSELVGCDLRDSVFDGLRLRGTKFIRCRMHGIQGKPVLEGPVEVIDPDLSVAGDGSKIVAGSEVLKAWA
jgi:uncharacterized protein YjbI with pentapeptide repeats